MKEGRCEDDAKMGRYVNYIVVAKLAGPQTHDEHDNDPAFKVYGEKAEAFQPEGPSMRAARRSSRSD